MFLSSISSVFHYLCVQVTFWKFSMTCWVIGVLISYDLLRGAQVDAAVNKANTIWGIVYRTFGPTNQNAFSIFYITLVWPIPDYYTVLQISSDSNDRMGTKIKTHKIPRASNKTKKNSWTKNLTPKNPMPNFQALKISRRH